MKIITIVGARPQFIKAAAVSRKLREVHDEVLVHTGQHYDPNMSQIFFDQLDIPAPDYHLGIGSGLHGAQTGAMMSAIEEVLIKERPNRVMVYGDTNSTLAGALAAAKLHIPVAHVEAGLRSFNKAMPEEINRVVADHLSDLLFCPGAKAITNLAREGIERGVHGVGDVMYEALMHALNLAEKKSDVVKRLNVEAGAYVLATIHRAENTDDPDRLLSLIETIRAVAQHRVVVFPVHPRTRAKLVAHAGIAPFVDDRRLIAIEPAGYLDMVQLEAGADVILTDSGGIQKEAYWLQIPCVTLREETEWEETVEQGWNSVAGINRRLIFDLAMSPRKPTTHHDAYQGRGSVDRLVRALG